MQSAALHAYNLYTTHHRPRVCNLLPPIRFVLNSQLWYPFLNLVMRCIKMLYFCQFITCYLLKYLFWSKTHSMHIISPSGQAILWSHHELDCGSGIYFYFLCFIILPLPETIIYVHHGQPGVWLEVALVYPGSQGVMEYLDCIVCGASARVRVIGDNTWEPGR